MKAIEHAKAIEHWVSGDAGIRGEECRSAAKELRRLAELNADLLDALKKLESAFMTHTQWNGEPPSEIKAARAAIKKATQ